MPEMDGMETLGRIISKFRDIPIILNTAYSTYKQDFMSWSADAYVLKSSDLRELKWWVQELLDEPGTIPYTVGEPTLNLQTNSGKGKFIG
jgi:CheY-like chemotaxis protein